MTDSTATYARHPHDRPPFRLDSVRAARRDELVRIARRLAAERDAAIGIVTGLRSRLPLLDLPPLLPESWRTCSVVEELCRAARELLQSSPQGSVTAAKLATSIAAELDHGYPPLLRNQAAAQAWCVLGEAWRAAGDPQASLRALDSARAAVEREAVLASEEAAIDLARARTLAELGELADASRRAVLAKRAFDELGMPREAAECAALLKSSTRATARFQDIP